MTKSLFLVLMLAVQSFFLSANSSNNRCFAADEPPVINPFGPAPTQREDAVPGYVELSDGKICAGQV